jgi:class 3 adenylate cyclase/predicted ATPase
MAAEPEAERRDVAVLFCDLADSTALAARLDPEELRDVLRAYQELVTTAVRRYDGHVAQYLGDGVLVYFGYPIAHEDDARRAVLAGLAILRDIDVLNVRLASRGLRLAVRLGLDTGPVVTGVVGVGEARERLALGHTPNVAARLQGFGEPDSFHVSAATHRLVERDVVCEPLGAHLLKGLGEPMEIFRVVAEREGSAVRARRDASRRTIVDRVDELARLAKGVERARGGQGEVVLLVSEPGIGKSRLVQALRECVAPTDHSWLLCACSAYETASALTPVTTLLEQRLRLDRRLPPSECLARLRVQLEPLQAQIPDAMSLLAGLLGIPREAGYVPPDLTPEAQRERTFATLVELIASWRRSRVVVLVLEDLHWADPSTRDLFGRLAERAPSLGLYVILTSRPVPDIEQGLRLDTTMRLGRLDEASARELALGVVDQPIPRDVLDHIVERTDGVALFVEEMTKTVLESGLIDPSGSGSPLGTERFSLAIPTTLKGSLVARLDHVGEAKPVAQLASVLGREFSYDLLREMSQIEESALRSALERLVRAELVERREDALAETYVFRHALIQEAAYDMILKRTRRDYHARAARTIVERFPDQADARPEIVAHHYSEAGLTEPAVDYWLVAGERALRQSAMIEAAMHLRRGLDLLSSRPESPERDRRELALQINLGGALRATRGFAAPEVAAAYARARTLCGHLGDPGEEFWALVGLFEYVHVRGDADGTEPICRRLAELGAAIGDEDLKGVAIVFQSTRLFYLGRFAESLATLDAIGPISPTHEFVRERLGAELPVAVHFTAAMDLWHLGRADAARARQSDALAVARASGHAFTLALALTFAALFVEYCRRDTDAVAGYAAELLQLSERHGLAIQHAQGNLFGAWARAMAEGAPAAGAVDEAAAMSHMLGAYRATGARLAFPFFSSMWIEVCAFAGRREEALRGVDDALAIGEATGDRMWQAELHRLRGEILLGGGAGAEGVAEAAFERALAVATGQGSLALELRAATSLGRLRVRQGRPADARALVAPRYARFTEGFDTRDLREARDLLDATA